MKNDLGVSIPKDFSKAVKEIKLAILQARAKAARLANAEALKLYFYVGGYISMKTRTAEWGSSAIDALSAQLQVELPGLRGFAPSNIKNMRIFFEAWSVVGKIRQLATAELDREAFRHLPSVEIRQLPTAEICDTEDRHLRSGEIRPLPLAVQGYSQPIGIATYQALRNIPEPYKTLAPVIDGVRKVMAENVKARSKDAKRGGK